MIATSTGTGHAPQRPAPPVARVPSTSRRRWQPSTAVAGRIHGLDGVRAMAVAMVVVYHLWPSRFPGGFIGVDVFFVISGFLITTLLIRERATSGHVDLGSFWRRRARRLLPALLLLIPVCIIAARAVDGDLLVGIRRQTIGALTFSSNWLEIDADADYFNHSAPRIFSMLWSLAVEEQFYLVWPVVTLALLTVTRSPAVRLRIVLAAAACSAVLMAVRVDADGNATRVYYGTDTHLFGLMIGAALAIAMSADVGLVARPRWLFLRRWIGFVAVGGLIVLGFTLHSTATSTYRGGLVLASLLSAVAVASLPGPPTAFTGMCRLAPLAWVGRRSYGIYLWHWPVLVIVMAASGRPFGLEPSNPAAVAAIGITFVVAQASWVLVEQPFQCDGLRRVAAASSEPRVRLAVATIVVVTFAIIATAPATTSAQASIEDGTRLIATRTAQTAAGTSEAVASEPPSALDDPAATPAPATAADPDTSLLTNWTNGTVPSGDLIFGLGDSVMSGGAEGLYRAFAGIRLDAKPNRQWKNAPAIVQWAIGAGLMRPVVVIDLGTNAGLATETQRAAFADTLDLLGPRRRIVLVNLFSPSRFVGATNDLLAAAAAERPNVVVADWHAAAVGHAEYFHDDATHPNITGVTAYVDVLKAALTDLGPGAPDG